MATFADSDRDVFRPTGFTEEQKDIDLALYLLDRLETYAYPWNSEWDRDSEPTRVIANVCQVAEAISLIPFAHLTNHLFTPAIAWLTELSNFAWIHHRNYRHIRIYPSRFKTLTLFGHFARAPTVQNDFHALSEKLDSNTGRILNVAFNEMDTELVTMIWLDTIFNIERAGASTQVWSSGCACVLETLDTAFARWLEDTPPNGALFNLTTPRDASYALDLLLRAGRIQPRDERTLHALDQLMDEMQRRRAVDKIELGEMYCGLQLCAHGTSLPRAQESVRMLLRTLRKGYEQQQYHKVHLSFHALALRVIGTFYGSTFSSLLIESLWERGRQARETEHLLKVERRNNELKKLVHSRFHIQLGKPEVLSGGRAGNTVYRVQFGFITDATDANGTRMSFPENSLRVIIKEGDLPSLLHAREAYAKLPDDVKKFFAEHTSKPESISGDPHEPWYLIMQDLARFRTLSHELDRLDLPTPTMRQKEDIVRLTRVVARGLNTIHRVNQPLKDSAHTIDNFYLVPLQRQLGLLSRADGFPALKTLVFRKFKVNSYEYRPLSAYLARLRTHQDILRPKFIGLAHCDCHTRNLMIALNGSGTQNEDTMKFIDLEHLSYDQDYLVDYGLLLEDVAFYRYMPDRETRGAIGMDQILVQIPGAEPEGLVERWDVPLLRYPSFPPSTQMAMTFQYELLDELRDFADAVKDEHWKPRLWLNTARALTLLSVRRFMPAGGALRSNDDWALVAMIYAETVRLLSELVQFLDDDVPLPNVPFPGALRPT
ncbi:MAG: hypothetical protein EYC68_03020 [Chloroflexota bacterium]|nr:MAG: hypothetical protein EYC68_03020 [Chloroflexota bacterium]